MCLSSSYIAIDPLEPVLGTVASGEVLEIVHDRDSLGLGGAKEVFLDRICALSIVSGDPSEVLE